MELNFVETIEGKEWVAEFEAPSDFNLHIERADSGSLVVSQRGTASGEYETAFVKGMYEGGIVIDCDFGALVYPKWIKVVSSSKVVSASVNFNEGGGSGSGSGSELKWEYYKINHPEENWDIIMNAVIWATYLYYTSDDSTWIEYIGRAYPYISDDYRNVHKIACSSIPMGYISSDGYSGNANEGSWKSNFIKFSDGDYDEELFDAVLTPITKEEFYTFDNDNVPV